MLTYRGAVQFVFEEYDMRVLLIFPKLQDMSMGARPPLGLLTVAAPLVEKGIDVVILDERIEDDFDNILLSELGKKPVCVGISAMSVGHLTPALRISAIVKKKGSIPVVWGGVHASLSPESTIKHELVDIIVRDDGEETFPLLLESLAKGLPLYNILGIGYKVDGKIVINEPSLPAEIDKLPIIPFHLLDLSKYISIKQRISSDILLPLETSRGCPFACLFCTESVRKKKWRAFTPQRVIEDIKIYVQKYGIRDFIFVDDNFFGNIKRGEEIVDLLVKENLDIRWYTSLRTDYMAKADKSFIDKLEKAGCKLLTFGAESGSEEILKMINKESTIEKVKKSNRLLVGSTIQAHFVLIKGFPNETIKDIRDTYLLCLQLILDNPTTVVSAPMLIPTPGTKIAEMCLGSDRDRFTLEDWVKVIDYRYETLVAKPHWIQDDTYDFIKKQMALESMINKSTDLSLSIVARRMLRIILKVYHIGFKLGLEEQLSSVLNPLLSVYKKMK